MINEHYRRTVLTIHADDASKARPLKHVIKGLVDLREGDFMCYEFLQFKFLHQRIHNSTKDEMDTAIDSSNNYHIFGKAEWMSFQFRILAIHDPCA